MTRTAKLLGLLLAASLALAACSEQRRYEFGLSSETPLPDILRPADCERKGVFCLSDTNAYVIATRDGITVKRTGEPDTNLSYGEIGLSVYITGGNSRGTLTVLVTWSDGQIGYRHRGFYQDISSAVIAAAFIEAKWEEHKLALLTASSNGETADQSAINQ